MEYARKLQHGTGLSAISLILFLVSIAASAASDDLMMSIGGFAFLSALIIQLVAVILLAQGLKGLRGGKL